MEPKEKTTLKTFLRDACSEDELTQFYHRAERKLKINENDDLAKTTIQCIEEIWMDRDFDEVLMMEETQRQAEEKNYFQEA